MTTWQDMLTEQQRVFLCTICDDLSRKLAWHGGMRLSKDDYRWMISGTVSGMRFVPGIETGDGRRGWVMLGKSCRELNKRECTDAITLALHLGDHPEEQGLPSRPVRWCDTVLRGLGYTDADLARLAA